MPGIGIVEEITGFFAGNQRREGETVVHRSRSKGFMRRQRDPVASRAQLRTQTEVGKYVAIGAYRGKNSVHRSYRLSLLGVNGLRAGFRRLLFHRFVERFFFFLFPRDWQSEPVAAVQAGLS